MSVQSYQRKTGTVCEFVKQRYNTAFYTAYKTRDVTTAANPKTNTMSVTTESRANTFNDARLPINITHENEMRHTDNRQ